MTILFKQLQQLIKNNNFNALGRTRYIDKQYRIHKNAVNRSWVSISDYMLNRIFNISCDVDGNGKKYIDKNTMSNKIMTKITFNRFPYNFEPHVSHYLLWKLNESITEKDILNTVEALDKKHDIVDYVDWTNPLEYKSIVDVEHAHIVIKTTRHKTKIR